MLRNSLTLLLLLSACNCTAEISYKLSMPDAPSHYFNVEMHISTNKNRTIQVSMPVWAPGSYLVREFSKDVELLSAIGSDNKSLVVQAVDKNTWQINTSGQNSIIIKYRVYAFELSVRTSFIDESHAYLNGTSVFMFVNGREKESCSLEVVPYQGWEKISTGLIKNPDSEWKYTAHNYDDFADCPIEIGNHKTITFTAAGVPHEIAIFGESNCDIPQMTEDFSKLINACVELFGDLPVDRYVFIIHNLDHRGGGLEHKNSTTLQFDRWSYTPESSYISFLSLALHEYIHLWLVKRLRAKALGPFDYENENYTDLLWVMEGVTSYYDEYLLLRTGFIQKNDYLNRLATSITELENRPGNNIQSLAHASFYAWIKAYRPNENSENTSVSYYGKGSVVAALLDLEIRKSTADRKSLDDLMRYLYNKFYKKNDIGFTHVEFIEATEFICGRSMKKFFDDNVFGVSQISYDKYFEAFNISVVDINKNQNNPFLGVKTSMDGNKLKIESIIRNSPAYNMGCSAGDEIIALDGNRVNQSLLLKLISMKSPGDKVTLMLSRMGLIMEKEIVLATSKDTHYALVENPEVNTNTLKESWLGADR